MDFDVIALGELLIDFAPAGLSEEGNPLFEANPGGAPCNVLSMLAKLGHNTAFIGKVGDDIHGRRLAAIVKETGIDTSCLLVSPQVDTTLAFVEWNEEGDRSFSFFRRPGADTMLTAEEIDKAFLSRASIFHFGSLSLTDEPARSATVKAVAYAKEAHCLISYDPNYRPPLWKSPGEARKQMLWGCAQCDVLKLAREELEFMTGIADVEEALKRFRKQFPNIKMLLLTDGKRGSRVEWKALSISRPTYLEIKAVDTTGAGDTFMGCCLHHILQRGLTEWDQGSLGNMLEFANAAASLVTAKKGAIRVMPDIHEISLLMHHVK